MPDLWSKLHPNHVVPPSIPSEYPKWVTGQHGKSVVVQSRAEEAMVTGRPYDEEESAQPEPVNALFASARPSEPEVLPEKSRLQLEAQALGVEVDRRWGVKKLRAEIEARR